MNIFLKRGLLFFMTLMIAGASAMALTADELIANLKKDFAPDARMAVWNVEAVTLSDGSILLNGKVDSKVEKDAIVKSLTANGVKFYDALKVLENSSDKPWAVVMLSIATLRFSGAHSSETATQGIMGMPLKVLEESDEWLRVQCPDQYIAWIPKSSVYRMTDSEYSAWKRSKRYIVTVYQSQMVSKAGGDATVSDLVLGNILEFKGQSKGWIKVSTPDGREGFVSKKDVKELSDWADQSFNEDLILKTAHRMMGSSYLWGGTSTKATDCSGLVKVSYFANGIILLRDASLQALTGKKIAASDWQSAKPGDLLFFGSTLKHVSHVAIYLGKGQYIHCSGRVKINSVDPSASDYLPTPFISISRIDGMVGTKGITTVKDNPWYF